MDRPVGRLSFNKPTQRPSGRLKFGQMPSQPQANFADFEDGIYEDLDTKERFKVKSGRRL
jgi:hypothetical protein